VKLILKLPKDKPPFIGILLSDSDNRSYPERLNEDLINEHKYAGYRLIFELNSGRLDLGFVSEEAHITRYYKELEFDGAQLALWVYSTRNSKQFNFGHVRLEWGRETIVKTWGKKTNFVLPVKGYELKGEFLSS
jgi:hypothetical protein